MFAGARFQLSDHTVKLVQGAEYTLTLTCEPASVLSNARLHGASDTVGAGVEPAMLNTPSQPS